MILRHSIPALCLIGAMLAAIAWWHGNRQADAPPPTPVVEKPARPVQGTPPAVVATPGSELETLTTEIRAMSRADAVAQISAILASGRDFETGSEFTLDADGNLTAAPTLRTRLLDDLATIDPAAAADISRDILATPTTADEWAIALRNLGRVEDSDESREFLRRKTEELIRNPAWQAAPSIGYLNAFDVLVHTEAVESTPLLSDLVQNNDRRDLAHAAFLTLDRLVQRQPVEMLGQLAADTALQQSRPEMTAQQFARADLRDPAQREIVQHWLLAPARTPTELNAFAGVFPNHNQFVSNNLLTRPPATSGSDLAAHDREVLGILASWAENPAFQPVAEPLAAMIRRLIQFTGATPNDR